MKKEMQRTAPVRFTDYHDHQMAMNLRIYNSGKHWDMDIIAQGQAQTRIPIRLTQRNLDQLNSRLQSKATLMMLHAASEGDLAREEWDADVAELAEAGHSAFTEIFSESAQKTMKQRLAAADHVTIEINSEDFFVPWELLYSDDLDKKPSFENFWGMKHIIYHLINQDDRPGDVETTTISVGSKPRLGLFALKDATLPSIGGREIPFFNDLNKEGKIALRKLPRLDPTVGKKDCELLRFKQFLNQSQHVVHFACHALSDEKYYINSFIQLSDGIRISLGDLSRKPRAVIKDFPLVVLNACRTGQTNPMDARHFAGDFIKYGALGVVATQSAVPDRLAADFSRVLYPHLLEGEYLGESILSTRQELFREGNPAGLLYALYAPPIIRLDMDKGTQKKKKPARSASRAPTSKS